MTMRISNQNNNHKIKITGILRDIGSCFNDDFLDRWIDGPNLDDGDGDDDENYYKNE